MRSYWLRIVLGAAVIFVIGMIGITLVRRGVGKVNAVVAGAGPLSIPLPFVPFELGGKRLGKLERLVVNRDAPKKVSSVELAVQLDDSLMAQGLAGCRLAANLESDSSKPGNLNFHARRPEQRAFFSCVPEDSAEDSSLVEFGTVTLNPGEVEVPLLVPQSLADELSSGNWSSDGADSADALAQHAESLAAKAEKLGDSIAAVQGLRAESLAANGRRLGDSLRKEGLRRSDSLHRALGRMADSLPGR
jgi:hypothetical protein